MMLLNCGVGEDSWESLGLQGDPSSPSYRKSVLNIHWKDWCWSWSWSSNTLATWCEELTHLKIPWCWERLKAGGERDNRGWDGWMASLTQWTWVWVSSGSWWWTTRPGVLQSMGSHRVRHDWSNLAAAAARLVTDFLPRSKCLLISWLQSPFSDFGAQENKVCHCFHCSPIHLPWSDGTRWHISFLNIEFWASFFTLLFQLHQEAL